VTKENNEQRTLGEVIFAPGFKAETSRMQSKNTEKLRLRERLEKEGKTERM